MNKMSNHMIKYFKEYTPLKCKYYAFVSSLLITVTSVLFFASTFTTRPLNLKETQIIERRNRTSNTTPNSDSMTIREIVDQLGIPDNPRFQQINEHDAWVFSAFYDIVNNQSLIRLFGSQAVNIDDTVFCYIFEKDTASTAVGKRIFLLTGRGKRSNYVSYECEISKDSHPTSVSLTFKKSDTPTNLFKVFYPPPLQRNFTVCHAGLYNYRNYKLLIQSVELNRVFGAEHIFVYNISVSNETDAVLRYYQKQNFLTVIPFLLPVSQAQYQGQILAMNDCLYRNKGVSRFIAFVDTDELIIPNHHDNWYDLIAKIDEDFYATRKNSNIRLGSYLFESTFFQDRPSSSEWQAIKLNNTLTSEEERILEQCSLTVFTHVKQLKHTFGRLRTKTIVRTELIMFSTVHFTYSHRGTAVNYPISVNLALLHHQRKFDNSRDGFVEATSWRFKDRLIPLVNKTFNELVL
ncbi:hypothetical protein Btru_062177 [Bulinus truncatus]|nr:hypothetical protein Btru_062177 [Bulinus truncatus]